MRRRVMMNRDDACWELMLFLLPAAQERPSFRFWLVWFLGLMLIEYFTLNAYAMMGWGIGYLTAGLLFAWEEGVFDID
jgi:hypothetical protein